MNRVRIVAHVADTAALAQYQYKIIIQSVSDGTVLWQGPVQGQGYADRDAHHISFNVEGLSPVLWTPVHPYLYLAKLQLIRDNKVAQEVSERLGFRKVESRNGQIYLNDKPIFLRGIAINPPGRGIPDSVGRSRKFAEDYVKYMKSIHVNIIRIPDEETWYDVCDEQGMMVFGGNYAGGVNGQQPPGNYEDAIYWYKEKKFLPIAGHPSLMIYALVNEAPFRGPLAPKWEKFLSYAYDQMEKWDSTRVYIANAGYGYGKSGDICDIHRYWGWYYASPFTFLHIRYNEDIIPFKKKVQPVTFTECVGNYTGPDGRYNLSPNHKNPGSQLNWTGNAPEELQARLANEHQSYTFKQAAELFRRLRSVNSELSGLFPFTILYYNWQVGDFVDMSPKPVTQQARLSYAPVLLSWECWTPNAYAAATLQPIVHIVNDDDDFQDLKDARLVYQLLDGTKTAIVSDTLALPLIKYYDTWQDKLDLKIPADLPAGSYQLKGAITRKGKTISENYFDLYIAGPDLTATAVRSKAPVLLYDPSGKTEKALKSLSVDFRKTTELESLPLTSVLLIGENAADAGLLKHSTAIKQFVEKGGRLISLCQDTLHLRNLNALLSHPVKVVTVELDDPNYPPAPRPSRDGYYVNPEHPGHPLFAGIDRENLKVWSDYTHWDESQKGFPAIYPVTGGFAVGNKNDIGSTAVYGNYGPGLEGIALAEQFDGKGSVLLCGLDLVNRSGLDPVADRLLLNIVGYMGDRERHARYPIVTDPIVWGNYGSEKGLLTGVNSGLIVNGKPRLTGEYKKIPLVITAEGDEFAGKPGGWNDRPGLQYVAYGRRPFGPYDLRGLGVPRPLDAKNHTGEGFFWCSVLPGKKTASTLVWNPSTEKLTIKIKVNEKEVGQEIEPNTTAIVNCPVVAAPGATAAMTDIKMTFTGDRRLVLLQTSFK